jgi:hypothetical protein
MTTLPSLPTDNLYKFFFIGGLTAVILSVVFYFNQYNLIRNKMDNMELSILNSENEMDVLHEEANELKAELIEIKKGLDSIKTDSATSPYNYSQKLRDIMNDKNYREYLSFVFEHKKDIIPYYEQNNLLNIKGEEHKKRLRQISLNAKVVALKNKQLSREISHLGFVTCWVVVFIIVGSLMTVYGYTNWNKFVQMPTDERLRVELNQLKKDFAAKV